MEKVDILIGLSIATKLDINQVETENRINSEQNDSIKVLEVDEKRNLIYSMKVMNDSVL
jgi:hypothetical protein